MIYFEIVSGNLIGLLDAFGPLLTHASFFHFTLEDLCHVFDSVVAQCSLLSMKFFGIQSIRDPHGSNGPRGRQCFVIKDANPSYGYDFGDFAGFTGLISLLPTINGTLQLHVEIHVFFFLVNSGDVTLQNFRARGSVP